MSLWAYRRVVVYDSMTEDKIISYSPSIMVGFPVAA